MDEIKLVNWYGGLGGLHSTRGSLSLSSEPPHAGLARQCSPAGPILLELGKPGLVVNRKWLGVIYRSWLIHRLRLDHLHWASFNHRHRCFPGALNTHC